MSKRISFHPGESCELEKRIVLSHAHSIPPVSVHVSQRNVVAPKQSMTMLVNSAYASFSSDYDQARAIYYSNLSAPANTAFRLYTAQRVNVLAGQLGSALLVLVKSTAHNSGQANTAHTIQTLISLRVNGKGPTSLLSTLTESIPPAGTTPSSTTTLYSLSQDNAVEASRNSVLNGITILVYGANGNKSHNH
jgi:hypothetical protein